MARAEVARDQAGRHYGVSFECPGCGFGHVLPTQHTPHDIGGARWDWNDKLDLPTLSPSILSRYEPHEQPAQVCHSYVTDGRIQYLGDCTHALAGQTIDLPEITP